MVLDKKKKTLCWLMLSTSIATFSANSLYAQDLVPGPGEQAEFDEDENDPIFYVPQAQMNAGVFTDAYLSNGDGGYIRFDVTDGTNIYSGPNGTGMLLDTLGVITTGTTTVASGTTVTTATTATGSDTVLNTTNATFNEPLAVANGATANLTGGTFKKAVTLTGASTANVSGGTFEEAVSLSGTSTAKVTGTTTFSKLVTAGTGTTLVLGDNNNTVSDITFTEGLDLPGTTLDLKPGTKITIPAGKKLKISASGTVTLTGSNGNEQDITGAIEAKASSITFNNTKLAGGVELDPSLLTYTGSNTINGTLTLGATNGVNGAVANDSNNVILFEPGSSLTVTNKVILHNENALIVGYYPSRITPQGATTLLTATDGIKNGTDTDNKTFNYLFTLALNDNNTSTGILQPIDATVTNNDSTYKFNIVQTATGVSLSIDQNVEATAGSDMSAVITQLLNGNATFNAFVQYDASSAGYTARAANVVNALVGSFEAAKNGSPTKAPTDSVVNEFRFKPVQLGRNQNTLSRTENILKAIADNGPVSVKTDQGRVWISPFTNLSNSTGETAGRDWILGSLMGAEYRDLKMGYTIGVMGGANFGHSREKEIKENGASFTGVNGGLYASYGAWEGGRVDGMYLRSVNYLTESRMTDIGRIARNQHKLTVDMIDLQTSHVFKLPDDQWSLRFNAGHTYTHDNTGGYTETGAAHRNKRISSHTGRTYEAYGGVGLRWSCRGKEWRTRITGLYEYGQEYKKKASTVKTSHGSALNVHTFYKAKPTKEKTHYTTLYTTINNTDGWKFYLGYTGTFTKDSIGTGITLKGEYRF